MEASPDHADAPDASPSSSPGPGQGTSHRRLCAVPVPSPAAAACSVAHYWPRRWGYARDEGRPASSRVAQCERTNQLTCGCCVPPYVVSGEIRPAALAQCCRRGVRPQWLHLYSRCLPTACRGTHLPAKDSFFFLREFNDCPVIGRRYVLLAVADRHTAYYSLHTHLRPVAAPHWIRSLTRQLTRPSLVLARQGYLASSQSQLVQLVHAVGAWSVGPRFCSAPCTS